ncbi:MAG: hypothetical protein KA052_02850 [Candidatus Pacebacteria bacterium]|nr:hypothetical protein [Candidatus Paceibacterota bacterium]
MHQGNWTCSGCGGTITELPFEPRGTAGLRCRDCHQKQSGGSAPRSSNGDRPRISGDWTCSGCKAAITSLPFEPRDTSNLLCIDCFKKSKGG